MNITSLNITVFLLLFLAGIPVSAQSRIRDVDFKNFTHNLSCGTADKVSPVIVRTGEYTGVKKSTGLGNVDVYLKITDVLFGDINGDGRDEAVVSYSCGSGASYVYFRGLVYGIRKHRPVLLSEIDGGNKGDGGFRALKIKNGVLIVERYQLATGESPCCPSIIETTRYRLVRKSLVQNGKRHSRAISHG